MGYKLFDLYAVKEGKGDKTFFPPIGVAFLREEDGKEKITLNLNMFPSEVFHGSLRKPKEDKNNEPDF